MRKFTNSEVGEKREGINIVVHGIRRTNFWCRDGRIFSWMKSDGPTNPPSPDLPDGWETKGHSMWSLGLYRTRTIKEFWAIGCESGMEYRGLGFNDMAGAVGSYYTDQQGNHVHVYVGNTKVIWAGGLLNLFIAYPSAMAHIIQNHRNHDLEHALIYGPNGTIELKAVWGDDADRDGFLDNTLQWWPLDSRLSWINFF